MLPEALIAQLQAAVDAAREAQGVAQAAGAAEPAANPPGAADALDDLAESYLAADPDLTAGYADDAEIDDPGPGHRWSSLRAATSGWDALHDDAAPGTGVKHQRAAWWDHAMAKQANPVRHASQAAPPEPPMPRRRRNAAVAGVVALAVVVVAGGVVAVRLSSHHTTHNTKADRSSERKAARVRAAARLASDIASAANWVTNQVDRTDTVACDPTMCHALADDGFPGQRLDEIGGTAPAPPSATIVVDTPALRRQIGTGVPANWAPAVLAAFDVGADQMTVRVMAPHGAHAYESALRADWKQRQVVGASLLTSSQITTTRAARSALAAGKVDDRLLLVLTALASQHPIDILAFGRTWPGTSAGIPMRTAYLAESDPAAYLTEPVYVQAMIGLLRAQPPTYRPVNAGIVRLAGRKVLSIWFTAPSPLGLIIANP